MPDVNQQAELEKATTRFVYFVEFDFLSSTQYLCTSNTTITTLGHNWLGLGALGKISPVESSDSLNAKALDFTLNVAQTSWLALAVGAVEEYRGRPAKMFFCPLDESFNLVGTPEQCWNGYMDTVAIGMDGESGQITLRCETSVRSLKRPANFRLNAAQHKLAYPTDTGLDYLTRFIANPQQWLSILFQQR